MDRRSVLIINDEFGTSKGGISTVNRQIAGLAREAKFDVYCPVLSASQADKEDAKQKNITLVEPRIKDGLSTEYTKPSLDWLLCHESFFPDLKANFPHSYPDIIIGHAPVTTNATIDIKETLFPKSKLFLFNHVISEDIELHKYNWSPEVVQKKEEHAFQAAHKADVVFSVGPRMFDHFSNKYRALPAEAEHKQFIPLPDDSFFQDSMVQDDLKKADAVKKKQVITFGRITGVEVLKGYDVVAKAMSQVADSFQALDVQPPKWIIRGVPEGKGQEARETIKKYVKSKHLEYSFYPYGTQDEILKDLQQSHLCIMASKTEPFGLVGFEAMATGIPVLITKHSGLADFVTTAEFGDLTDGCIVNVGVNEVGTDEDVKEWAGKILGVLTKYQKAHLKAQKIKAHLKDCSAVKKSHKAFQQCLQDYCN